MGDSKLTPLEVMGVIQQIGDAIVPLKESGLFEPQDNMVAVVTRARGFVDVQETEERDDLVVEDEHGVLHAAVYCDRETDTPFVVAMCDFMDAVDYASKALQDPRLFKPPIRRWGVEKERLGVATCLFCIGA